MENEDIEARARAAGIVHVDEHVQRRLRCLERTSASAIDQFEKCERLWFDGYVEGNRSPSTPAQERGTKIHSLIEDSLRAGRLADEKHEYAPIVRDGMRLWPDLKVGVHGVEHEIRMETFPGGPRVVGYVDLWHASAIDRVDIWDHKSTSDFRYCKKEDELLSNTQMVTYAKWAYEQGAASAHVGHLYYRTKMPTRSKQVGPVRMDRERVDAEWRVRLAVVQRMCDSARTTRSADDAPATGALDVDEQGKTMCERYGGCHRRDKCGFETFKGTKMSGPNNGQPSLMDILNQHNAAQGQPAQSWPPVGAGGIIPQAQPGIYPPTQAPAVQPMALPHQEQPSTAPGYNPNHAHPGTVGIEGYRPGQPCNGNGHYASANGQGFIPVEPGHACPVCRPAMVVPPDAPARTSTPEEIKAVDEGKKKGRPKKAKQPDPGEMLRIYSELNEKKGFSLNEVERLFKENAVEDALSGKITPGMMRQGAPLRQEAPSPAPAPVAQPAPTLTNAVMTPEQAKAAQGSWYANSGPASQAQQSAPQAQQQPTEQRQREAQLLIDKHGYSPERAHGVIDNTYNNLIGTVASAPAQPTTIVNNTYVTQQPPAVASNPDPDAQRRAAQERVDQYVAQRRQRPLKLPATPPVILVDCVLTKASGQVAFLAAFGPVNLAEWLAPVAELAAKAAVDENGKPAPVDDWRMVPYGRGRGILAAAIRECLDSLPAVVLVDSAMSGADAFLECVAPHAALIVRGLR